MCGKALKMEHVMRTMKQAVNFFRVKDLNHCQFRSFLEELSSKYGDLPHRGAMAKASENMTRYVSSWKAKGKT